MGKFSSIKGRKMDYFRLTTEKGHQEFLKVKENLYLPLGADTPSYATATDPITLLTI